MAELSAKDIISNFLAQYGLESLGTWAWNAYTGADGGPGMSMDEIRLALPSTPEFKQRFPAYDALAKAGKAISPDQYMAYESTVRGLLQQWGIPNGMYDTPKGIGDLLISDVSAAEVSDRVQLAASAAFTAPQEVRDALRTNYGLDPGALIGYYLDPDKALPLMTQQYQAAQVSAASTQMGLEASVAESERLAQAGVTYDQALSGYGQVAGSAGLEAGVGGETASQAERTAAVFGQDAQSGRKVERVVKSRQAQFGDQGGAAATQQGVSGLRTSGK